jgi:UDP-2,3-diacylglucosamine hydrolase
LPAQVAAAAAQAGRRVFLFPLHGFADPALAGDYPHRWTRLGEFSRVIRTAKAEGCTEIVLIGSLVRPRLSQLSFDGGSLRLLPKIVCAWRGGDDHLLSAVGREIEANGLVLRAAHEIAPDILVGEGPLGALEPAEADIGDIRRAAALLAAIGPFDVGQAAVIVAGRIVAVEGAEGTDGLLARVADMRASGRLRLSGRAGVLVKIAKPGQDRRLDLPSIGPASVHNALRADLRGIAVEAGSSIVAEPQKVAEAADAGGLFVAGLRAAALGLAS